MIMDIKHDNIFYVRNISEIGGVETFVFEMVKKYKDLDIAVVYKTADSYQLARINKYCRAYKHENQKIICKVAIINYDVSIIDYITEDIWRENAKEGEGIYQVIHGDYTHKAYTWKSPTDDRIKTYIGITKHITEGLEQENKMLCYNPLTIEEEEKPLILVSATRLSPIKGKDRMIKLVNALDAKGINYIWYVFTNDTKEIISPNVIYMKQRLDISRWMCQADYLVQLSDTEACSYSQLEALYRNIPIITTPLPYLEEIGVKHGENAYIMDFDCSNIDEIVDKIKNKPSFVFNHLKDNYNNILAKGKSRYKEELNMKYRVRATAKYQLEDIADNELSFDENGNYTRTVPEPGREWIVDAIRKELLESKGFVEVVEAIDEPKEENPEKKEVKKATTKKKTSTRKK